MAAGEKVADKAAEEQRAARTEFLRRRFRFPTPDRSPIYEWAHRHIVLPSSYAIPGAFDVRMTPWLVPIFDALQDDSIRLVHLRKSIQLGGTLVSDVFIPWIICNDPGPISVTMHVDDMMERHAKMRLNPVLEACKPVAALLPRQGPFRTITEIHFGGFSLIMNAANLSDQQSQSIRWKINDEIWHPKWQGVYADAVGRVAAYERVGTSKIFNVSQAGVEGDVEDRSFRGAHQGEWSSECPACHKVHPLAFTIREKADDPESPQAGGVVWDKEAKGEDDMWDVARALRSTRFRCPHCAHELADSDLTRETWRKGGRYVVTAPTAAPTRKSFHVEAIVSRPMVMLVEEWLAAVNENTRTGNEEPMMKFRQKQDARPWKVERTAINIINVSASTYSLADYATGARVPGEHLRAMTLDRQQASWWCEVGAWTLEPQYYQLFFGRVDTIDAVRALQQRYRVPDSCVAQDRAYQPSKTDEDSVRYGWRGMLGASQGRKTWTMINEATGEMAVYPHSDPKYAVLGGGREAPYYEWSGDHSKDLLFNALNGKGIKWNLPRDVSAVYLDHLKSEAKVEVRPGVWRYVEQVQNRNHGLDCGAMMMMLAIIAGIVRFKLAADEK